MRKASETDKIIDVIKKLSCYLYKKFSVIEKFQCHFFEESWSVKNCFSNVTADLNSLEECCIVLRLCCNFEPEKFAAWFPWRTSFKNRQSRIICSVWFSFFFILFDETKHVVKFRWMIIGILSFIISVNFCRRVSLSIRSRLRNCVCIKSILLYFKKSSWLSC